MSNFLKIMGKKIREDYMSTPKSVKILFILIIIGSITFFILNGCKTASDDYIVTSYNNAELMLPDLEKYIEKDTIISPDQRVIRIEAIKQWRSLLKTAYEAVKGS